MYNRQIESLPERIQFFTKRDRVPVLVAVKQDDRPLVRAIGERSDNAHHRSDADSTGNEHMHVRGVAVDCECAVRPIEVDALSYWNIPNLACEVAKIPDRHLDAPAIGCRARREGERVPGNLKRGASHREPAELAGSEMKPGVSIRLHRHCPGIAALLAHFRDAVWLAEHKKGLDDADVKQQSDPEKGKEDPQRPL